LAATVFSTALESAAAAQLISSTPRLSAICASATERQVSEIRPNSHRVGVLRNMEDPEIMEEWLEGLRERGYVVGRNLQIEYRYSRARPSRSPRSWLSSSRLV
jgi:hypothetical protein